MSRTWLTGRVAVPARGAGWRESILAAMDGQSEPQEQHRELFVRPSYRQRANQRWPFVIFPIGAMTAVGVLTSGRSGWGLLGNALIAAYWATIWAILLTLLVALVPGRPRPLPEASKSASGTRLGNPTGTQRGSVPQEGEEAEAENGL